MAGTCAARPTLHDAHVSRHHPVLPVVVTVWEELARIFGLPASSPAKQQQTPTGSWIGLSACRPIHLLQAPLLVMTSVRAEAAGRHLPGRIEPSSEPMSPPTGRRLSNSGSQSKG